MLFSYIGTKDNKLKNESVQISEDDYYRMTTKMLNLLINNCKDTMRAKKINPVVVVFWDKKAYMPPEKVDAPYLKRLYKFI